MKASFKLSLILFLLVLLVGCSIPDAGFSSSGEVQSHPVMNGFDCVKVGSIDLSGVYRCTDPEYNNICYIGGTGISCVKDN